MLSPLRTAGTAATVAFLSLVLIGQHAAVALCIAGFGNTLECHYLSACAKLGNSSDSCSCSYDLLQQAFPADQLGTAVDFFEAYAANDQERRNMIEARLGFGALEFKARLDQFSNAAAHKCGR